LIVAEDHGRSFFLLQMDVSIAGLQSPQVINDEWAVIGGIRQVSAGGRELDAFDFPFEVGEVAQKPTGLQAPDFDRPGQVAGEQRAPQWANGGSRIT
jgi:hypothetical protein